MIAAIESIISNYGYFAIFIGCFFEGEVVMIAGGLLASQGLLSLPNVFLIGFFGTLASDQFYFWLGRTHGKKILKKTNFGNKIRKIHNIFVKHRKLLALGFRFLYGLRIVTPIMIGASEMKWGLFLSLNMAGVAVWALTMGTIGYAISGAIGGVMKDIKFFEMWFLIAAFFIGLAVWLMKLYKIRLRNNNAEKSVVGEEI